MAEQYGVPSGAKLPRSVGSFIPGIEAVRCAVCRVPLTDKIVQANALSPNWGHSIFQSANEIAANTMLRKQLDVIQSQTDAEKEWWEKRREGISRDFMKELDVEPAETSPQGTKASSEDEPVLVDTDTPSATPSSSKKKKAKK
jgi:translocation protein SEC66